MSQQTNIVTVLKLLVNNGYKDKKVQCNITGKVCCITSNSVKDKETAASYSISSFGAEEKEDNVAYDKIGTLVLNATAHLKLPEGNG